MFGFRVCSDPRPNYAPELIASVFHLQAESRGDFDNEELARFHFAHDGTLAGLAAILGLLGSPGLCAPQNASQVTPLTPHNPRLCQPAPSTAAT